MQSGPLVSIGVPNYNYGRFITTALDSIVNQTYKNIEIIIIDDHSTDDSVEVINNWIKNYKGHAAIKLIINQQNQGIAKVSNLFLHNATGKYFQALDADDILLPEKIGVQVDMLEANANAALIYSDISMINEQGEMIDDSYLKRIGYDKDNMPQGRVHEQLFDFNFIPNSSVLVNTGYARAAGGFDETLQVQDYYLWLKLSEQYEVMYMAGNTALYRLHKTSLSSKESTNAASIAAELALLYRYYKNGGSERKKKIKKNIHHSAAYLYQLKYPAASYWLKRDLLLNPGFKTAGYYFASIAGIPFAFFSKIKSLFLR